MQAEAMSISSDASSVTGLNCPYSKANTWPTRGRARSSMSEIGRLRVWQWIAKEGRTWTK
jgi:hypothetical protein